MEKQSAAGTTPDHLPTAGPPTATSGTDALVGAGIPGAADRDPPTRSTLTSSPVAPGPDRRYALVAVGAGTFLSAFSGSAVGMAIPGIDNYFGCGFASSQWVLSSYLLVVTATLLVAGRLGDGLGHRRIYLIGFTVFSLASLGCAAAPTLSLLIAARAVQALGAAALFAGGPAILTRVYGRGGRGQALGIQAMMTYLGLAVGPTVGGWLIHQADWRLVFTVNAPVGLLGLALAAAFIPEDAPPATTATSEARPGGSALSARTGNRALDLPGAVAWALALTLLLLGLRHLATVDADHRAVAGLLLGSVLALLAFVGIERRQAAPLLQLSLFRSRLFTAAIAAATCNYVGLQTAMFLLPFFLERVLHLPVADAGQLMSTLPVVMMVAAPLSGRLSDRIGSRVPGTVGLLVLAAALAWTGSFTAATAHWQLAIALGLMGLGNGLFISPNSSALMGSAPRDQLGVAGALLATARNLGMLLGVAIATVLAAPRAGPPAPVSLARPTATALAERPAVPPAIDSPASDAWTAGMRRAMLAAAGIVAAGAAVSAVRGPEAGEPAHQRETRR